jgi:beta-N-acetylhexosaminidase
MSLRELRRQAGRFAIVGFTGHSAPDDLRRLVTEFDLAGVILFARNIVEPAQVAELNKEVAALAREWPFWISVDQEGGRVARLKAPFTVWPPMATIGRSGDEALAERFARALAAELLAVGFNLDYTPVLDVHTNPANPVIGDRAFASDANEVARFGAAIIRGLQDSGVAACGKHFPGHGDTSVDSHEGLPIVEHDMRRLEAIELVPFRRAVTEQVAAIMTAHVMVPAADRSHVASFSPAIVTTLLKQTLGYQGVVISDDLGMKAVAATTPLPEATVSALRAGCDVVLLCNSTMDEQWQAIEAIIRAAERGELTETRLDDARARQRAVKERFSTPQTKATTKTTIDVVGQAAHRAIAEEMAAWR